MIYDYLLTNCHSSTIRTRNDRRIIFQKENDSVVVIVTRRYSAKAHWCEQGAGGIMSELLSAVWIYFEVLQQMTEMILTY